MRRLWKRRPDETAHVENSTFSVFPWLRFASSAFAIPSLHRLVEFTERTGKRDPVSGRMRRGRSVSMVVLCPTRELARQVQEQISEVAGPLGLFTEVFHGGVSYEPQARALRMGLDVLVGTPGRVIDHIQSGNLDLSECEIAVLDEADEMLNMGFAEVRPEKVSCLGIAAPCIVSEGGLRIRRSADTYWS